MYLRRAILILLASLAAPTASVEREDVAFHSLILFIAGHVSESENLCKSGAGLFGTLQGEDRGKYPNPMHSNRPASVTHLRSAS